MNFVDPWGLVIRVSATEAEQIVILTNLQNLTNHNLEIVDDEVRIAAISTHQTLKSGNNLINRLIDNEHTVIIIVGAPGSRNFERTIDPSQAINSKGSDAVINFDPTYDPDILTVDPETGNVISAKRPIYIGLAHEMIHADRAMRGKAIEYSEIGKYKYQIEKTSWTWGIFSGYKRIYETKEERKEELATVGLKYDNWGDITENDIRAEQGLDLRGAY
jgi:hypothetical protein